MNDDPDLYFDVSTAEIEAAVARGDYAWLCANVFGPALVQFLEKKNTDALMNNPRPRARRLAGMRRPRTRRISQVPA